MSSDAQFLIVMALGAIAAVCVVKLGEYLYPTEPSDSLWEKDCIKWRGRTLTGKHGHWCPEWDYLPIDETMPEWPCGCSESDI